MKMVVRKGIDNESSTKTMLRSAFVKTLGNIFIYIFHLLSSIIQYYYYLGGRGKSKQEATHLALSMRIVISFHKFVNIRLNGMSRLVEVNAENISSVSSYNILDAYALRLDKQKLLYSLFPDRV